MGKIKKNHSLIEAKQKSKNADGAGVSHSVCITPLETPIKGEVSKLTAETSLTSLKI